MSDRAGINESDVVLYSRAVATALSVAAATQLETASEQLPSEFDVIFKPSESITMDGFLTTVQERAGIDARDAAQDVTNTTLRTLGERLSEGEATDLALYLPDELKETLVGADEERPTDNSFDEFIQRVARREGVEKEEAKIHAQAVCSTLAETASERELDAAKKQLPDPFGVIFAPPDTKNKEI